MTTRYLADSSAVSRIIGGGADNRWIDASAAGAVAICDPVELELLRASLANTRRCAMQRLLRETYPWCPVPDDGWRRALDLQDRLAETSQHSGASPVDLVIAVTALRHGLTVLHDDRDYETISRVTGLPVQRVTE